MATSKSRRPPRSAWESLESKCVSTWKPGKVVYRRHWCGFLRNGHGYAFAYTLPEASVESDEPLLRSIVDATWFDQ